MIKYRKAVQKNFNFVREKTFFVKSLTPFKYLENSRIYMVYMIRNLKAIQKLLHLLRNVASNLHYNIVKTFAQYYSLARACIRNLVEYCDRVRFSHADVKLTIYFSVFHQGIRRLFAVNFNYQ